MAANNIACMFEMELPTKGIDFFKVSAYLGSVRGMENGANLLWNLGRLAEAQNWYHYAIEKGSIDFQAFREKYVLDAAIEKAFDSKKFCMQLERDLRGNKSHVAGLLQKIEENQKGLLDITTEEGQRKYINATGGKSRFVGGDLGFGEEKIGVIMRHRTYMNTMRSMRNLSRIHLNSAIPDHLPRSAGVNLIGLKEIFFKVKFF